MERCSAEGHCLVPMFFLDTRHPGLLAAGSEALRLYAVMFPLSILSSVAPHEEGKGN